MAWGTFNTCLCCVVSSSAYLLLLLLSRFSRVRLCATPETAAHQAPLSLRFSRQELWSGLPFPSPMQESEKWKWSRSVVSDPQQLHGLQPSRLLRPWDFPGKSTGVGWHCLNRCIITIYSLFFFLRWTCSWKSLDKSFDYAIQGFYHYAFLLNLSIRCVLLP